MADPGDDHQPTPHSRKKQQLHPLDVWNDKAIATTEEDVLELCDEIKSIIIVVYHYSSNVLFVLSISKVVLLSLFH